MDDETKRLADAVLELIRRMAVHYGLWFANAANRFGIDDALAMEQEAGDRGAAILIERLCATLGTTITDGVPAPLAAMQPVQLRALLNALAINWLVLDGVWFQAVEQREGMAAAKAVNDACWSSFSPLEAARIKAAQSCRKPAAWMRWPRRSPIASTPSSTNNACSSITTARSCCR